MKPIIEDLKNSFSVGYNVYEKSLKEAQEIWDLYHNRQYTAEQEAILTARGQPKETFNIIKLFSRMLVGYYSTVVNTVKVDPVQISDVTTAALLSDLVKYTMRDNNMDSVGDKIKLDGLISGIMCSYVDVRDTGETDEFGRPIRKVKIEHVPSMEIVMDPLSRADDYSDARFIHRYKWLSKDQVTNLFGKDKVKELESYYNFLKAQQADFEYTYSERFIGRYKQMDNYLVVQTILVDDNNKTWNVYWSDEVILHKEEVTYKDVRFPYRIHKMNVSDKAEYYGIFREVAESQKAINQALIKIQLMVNTQKAFVQEGAVDNLAEFTNQFNRVNAIIPVNDLAGIRIENLNADVAQQYAIIDRSLDRIQRILGINDSFLGMAYASDSGRKVKLQQNASIMSLRYITGRIEQFYRLLGWDIVNLIKQYYTATQTLRITDDIVGHRWITINQPAMKQIGVNPDGSPQLEPIMQPVVDPASRKIMHDKWGNMIVAPVPTKDTDIAFSNVDISIQATAYNDEDEKNQLMMETILQGPAGQMLAQVNPAGYFKAVALSVQSMKTKYTPEIASVMLQTAQMLAQGQPMVGFEQAALGQVPNSFGNNRMSQQAKLPQNTNEGVAE